MRKKAWSVAALAGTTAVALAAALPAAAAAVPASASLQPPPVTVLTDQAGASTGDIFISPYGDPATYANGAEILSPNGKKVIWFHAVPSGQEAADFREQTYQGQPVLTFWQGTGLGGVSTGADYIYNSHYQRIATVKAGNGYSADGHEFLITPWNTALVLSYTTATANLTSIGGPADQEVIDGIVQEINIRTGHVLFQWNSAGHVPYAQSEQPLPASAGTPWDWFHINAVKVDTNGNLLIDARDTWTTYEVSRHTGTILWRLGGKDSSFTEKAASGQVLDTAGKIFAWQHDPEALGNGTYTFFDNESAGTANTGTGALTELPYSRVVTVHLNVRTHVATLVRSVGQPENLSAPSQGNGQTLGHGDLFAGWGSLPYFSEFSRSGSLLFNAELPAGVNTYRAYRSGWKPASR
jgi:Arylsulfotransferase (ASST)